MSAEIDKKIHIESGKLVYRHLEGVLLSDFLVFSLLLSILWNRNNKIVIVAWYVFSLVISVVRYLSIRYHNKNYNNFSEKIKVKWINALPIMAFLGGICFAPIGSLLMPFAIALNQMIMMFCLIGIIALANVVYSPIKNLYLVFLIPAYVPHIIWLLFREENYPFLGMLGIVYLVLMIILSLNITYFITRSLGLQFDNWQLINTLSVNNEKLQHINHELQERENALVALSIMNIKLQNNLLEQTTHDPLTGLFNRRFLDEVFSMELSRIIRNKNRLSVAMIDLDNFKHFNDIIGHNAGDKVLITISDLLKHHFRGSDIACRFGGDEFIVILPGSDIQVAYKRMAAFREEVKNSQIMFKGKLLPSVSISVGLAEAPTDGVTVDEIIGNADKALNTVKQMGKDRIETYTRAEDR